MWPLVMYSNYFEIVFTVTFLDSPTELISGTFLFKTVANTVSFICDWIYKTDLNRTFGNS